MVNENLNSLNSGVETKNNRLFLKLFEISEKEKKELREIILANGGEICVVIHPYFMKYKSDAVTDLRKVWFTDHRYSSQYTRIGKTIERILKTKKFKLPIVIFEEEQHIPKTEKRMMEHLKMSQKKVFIIPTIPDSSEPKFADTDVTQNPVSRNKESWKQLIDFFKEIGISKVKIMGNRLTIGFPLEQSETLPKDESEYRRQREKLGRSNVSYRLQECVGEAIGSIAQGGIEVEISKLTYPVTIQEIEKIETKKAKKN